MQFQDFSKAFDSVWHSALFHKLLSLKLPPCFVLWVRSFLSDRRAKVQVGGSHSRSFRIRRGVPQGLVLGPVLFILFVDDITKDLPRNAHASLYADDLAIWSSSQTRSKPPLLSNPPSPSLKHGPTYGDFHSIQRSVSPPFSLQIPVKPLSNHD